MRTHRFLVVSLLLALTVAACTAPTAPIDTSCSVRGVAHALDTDPTLTPLALSLLLVRDDALNGAGIDASAFTDIAGTFYLGPASPVAPNGSFELDFPPGADVPTATLVSADDFVYEARLLPTCALDASDAGASVSVVSLPLLMLSVPGIATYTIDGVLAAVITTEPIDLDATDPLAGIDFVTWVYATRAVDVASGAGCATDSFDLAVDVSLRKGWSQLEWVVTEGEGLEPLRLQLQLRNSSAASVHVYPAFPF